MNDTPENFLMYTDAQTVFDKIVDHLARQKRQALNGNDCVLLSQDGMKCAVGCLIPKSDYAPDFEFFSGLSSGGGRGLLGKWLAGNVAPHLFTILSEMQNVHDLDCLIGNPEPIHEWTKNLSEVAYDHSLNFDSADFSRKLNDPTYNN